VIRDRRPQVLITYNEMGGYGHPDHIQAHRVAMYAAQLAAVPSYRPDLGQAWTVQRILWSVMSQAKMSAAIRALREAGDTETFKGFDPDGGLMPMMAYDADIAVAIDGTNWIDRKTEAMLAHASQIRPDGPFFAATKVLGQSMWASEYYKFVGGVPFPEADTWADDIFAGLS
jgi:N-acetyl-1-D-myo-inositol-2-amino-2-deoxy-alpha-D-glucopyranoside deacetylase